MEIVKTCRCCYSVHRIEVTSQQIQEYANGAEIQDAFPNLTPDEREMLISGICGTCFDDIFFCTNETEEERHNQLIGGE